MNLPSPAPGPPPRLTMHAFWRELGDGMFNLDRGLPWTFWRMTREPGALIREFVVHRDLRIVRPVRWFLFGFAVLALVFQLSGGIEAARSGNTSGADGNPGGAADIQAVWWVMTQTQWLLLVSVVPAAAAGLGVAFKREQPEFAEMWVFCLYVGGQSMLLIAGLMAISLAHPLLGFAALPIPLLPALLYVASAVGYFGAPMPGRLVRAIAALALATALTLLFLTACFFVAMTVGRQVA